MAHNWVLAGLIVTTALAAALIVQLLVRTRLRRDCARARAAEAAQKTIFLFEGESLLDATPAAASLLAALPVTGADWDRLMAYLAPRFPQALPELAADSAARRDGVLSFVGTQSSGCALLRLEVERLGTRLRLSLAPISGADPLGLSGQVLADELHHMRGVLETAPVLAWRQSPEGHVTWANAAYRRMIAADGDAQPWPLPALFDRGVETGVVRRRTSPVNSAPAQWFDLHQFPAGDDTLNFAVSADAAVRAEIQLREFVQTLSKTFADLPIGLAVFDQQRRLQVFNPALTDLTTLGPAFLSARPSFEDVLDRLREARMMPELRDYRSWRQRMVALEQAAAAGYHCETWSLPGGQTYRITGRPHPGGAIALLIEDISTAMTLTRKFRAEIDLGRDIIEHLGLPVCVLSREGEVITASAACRDLIHGLVAGAAGLDLIAPRHTPEGKTNSAQQGALDALAGAVLNYGTWTGKITLAQGQLAEAVVTPIPGGMALLRLTPVARRPQRGATLTPAAQAAREMAARGRHVPATDAEVDVLRRPTTLAQAAPAKRVFSTAGIGRPAVAVPALN